jgi:hypothetical protein
MDSVQTIKTDGFLRLIVFTMVKITSTNKEILKITTTTQNDIVCISFNSKSAHSNPPNIYVYAERGQSQLSNGIRVWGLQTESS